MKRNLMLVLIPVLILCIALMGILGFLLVSDNEVSEVYLEQVGIARKYLSNGDYDNAILYYRSAIEKDKTQEEPYLNLAQIYYIGKSDITSAIAILETGYNITGSARIQKMLVEYTVYYNESGAVGDIGGFDSGESDSDTVNNVSINNKLIDIFYSYTYKDYTDNFSVKNENKGNGVYKVSYVQMNVDFEYKSTSNNSVIDLSTAKPKSYARPTSIRIYDIEDVIEGIENGVNETTLKALGCTNVKMNSRNSTVGSPYYTFTYRYCTFVVACNSDGVVLTENCYCSVVPPVGKEVVENVAIGGKVTNAQNNRKVAGASIVFRSGHNVKTGTSLHSLTCNSSGEYSVMLPPGKYTATVSATKYNTGYFNITVPKEASYRANFELTPIPEPTTLPPTEPAANADVNISGNLVDVTTGNKVSSANLVFRSGHNNKSGSSVLTTSVSNGTFTAKLKADKYTVEISANGYTKEYTNITVPQGSSYQLNLSISPVMSSEQIRIVLEWGAAPDDLDSHLTGTTADNNSVHIYFGNKRASYSGDVVAELDVDDTTGYGPETITLNNTNGTYQYKVHHFSGSGSLATSGAVVKVYQGNSSQPITIRVPSDISGRTWEVFNIVNGQIVDINGVTG